MTLTRFLRFCCCFRSSFSGWLSWCFTGSCWFTRWLFRWFFPLIRLLFLFSFGFWFVTRITCVADKIFRLTKKFWKYQRATKQHLKWAITRASREPRMSIFDSTTKWFLLCPCSDNDVTWIVPALSFFSVCFFSTVFLSAGFLAGCFLSATFLPALPGWVVGIRSPLAWREKVPFRLKSYLSIYCFCIPHC